MQLPSVSAISVEEVAPIRFSAPALHFGFQRLRSLALCCAVFLAPTWLRPIWLDQCPPLLQFSLLDGSFPLSFVSRAGETPLFGFVALWHHRNQSIQSEDFQVSGSSTSSVSHRCCGLSCIIDQFVSGLISSQKHQGFSLQGFPLKRRSACSHMLYPLMLLRRRRPPFLLSRRLGSSTIRSPVSYRVLSVVRVRFVAHEV